MLNYEGFAIRIEMVMLGFCGSAGLGSSISGYVARRRFEHSILKRGNSYSLDNLNKNIEYDIMF